MTARIPSRRSKYRAIPEYVGDIRFASRKEAARYRDLMLLESQGLIKCLKLQPVFVFKYAGEAMFKYIGDFQYLERVRPDIWETRIEDVKSPASRTQVYRIKKRLIEKQHGIKILET